MYAHVLTPLAELLVTVSVTTIVLRHLRHSVIALALQGLLLGALAAVSSSGPWGLASVALVVIAKGVAVPWLLSRTVTQSRAVEATESVSRWVYPGILAVLVAVRLVAPALTSGIGSGLAATVLLPAGLAVTLLGLVAVTARSLLPGQMLGLAVTENGVYATGVALTHGLPLFLDLAIVLDLLLALVLLAWLTGRIQSVWGHIDAEQLVRLRG